MEALLDSVVLVVGVPLGLVVVEFLMWPACRLYLERSWDASRVMKDPSKVPLATGDNEGQRGRGPWTRRGLTVVELSLSRRPPDQREGSRSDCLHGDGGRLAHEEGEEGDGYDHGGREGLSRTGGRELDVEGRERVVGTITSTGSVGLTSVSMGVGKSSTRPSGGVTMLLCCGSRGTVVPQSVETTSQRGFRHPWPASTRSRTAHCRALGEVTCSNPDVLSLPPTRPNVLSCLRSQLSIGARCSASSSPTQAPASDLSRPIDLRRVELDSRVPACQIPRSTFPCATADCRRSEPRLDSETARGEDRRWGPTCRLSTRRKPVKGRQTAETCKYSLYSSREGTTSGRNCCECDK